ncbi:hypothetical protein AAG570_011915 [Ranatra chinensis]|uniref:Uncharacterized protein n=1 Tax=Ranatra chinensis TaxID=642074 RepID=A0ABD0Z3K3_9HEMI
MFEKNTKEETTGIGMFPKICHLLASSTSSDTQDLIRLDSTPSDDDRFGDEDEDGECSDEGPIGNGESGVHSLTNPLYPYFSGTDSGTSSGGAGEDTELLRDLPVLHPNMGSNLVPIHQSGQGDSGCDALAFTALWVADGMLTRKIGFILQRSHAERCDASLSGLMQIPQCRRVLQLLCCFKHQPPSIMTSYRHLLLLPQQSQQGIVLVYLSPVFQMTFWDCLYSPLGRLEMLSCLYPPPG